jgi:hypothetical protein
MIGGVPGGRSTHGVCSGALSWEIADGRVGDVDLSGLAAVLVYEYDDDELGSPWRFRLHVDERGDESQQAALADVFLGRLGGERVLALPWIRKASNLINVQASAIEIERGPDHAVEVGDRILIRASRPVETSERVSCIVPGHDRAGRELYADELRVRDEPFDWELHGNCAFAADFSYGSS